MEENHQLGEIIDTPRIINPLLLSMAAAKTTFDDDHTKCGFYSIEEKVIEYGYYSNNSSFILLVQKFHILV